MRSLLLIATLCIWACIDAQLPKPNWEPRYLGNTRVNGAAFLEIYRSEDRSVPYEDQFTIYVSTFDPALAFVSDEVYYMRSPGLFLDNVTDWTPDRMKVYDKSAVWPNNPDYMPSSVIGTEGIVQTSGFLVNGKKNGQLQMYNTSMEPPGPAGGVNIAAFDDQGYSYHRVLWQDMDLDGDLDCVSCRFHAGSGGSIETAFMWFENPSDVMREGWFPHVINRTGPDVSFVHASLTAGGVTFDSFIFAEFFAERLSVYWTTSPVNDWSDPAMIQSRIIDATAGQGFDLIYDDINKDGVMEVTATQYFLAQNEGFVAVYDIPNDFRTDEWPRRVIADGFVPYNATLNSPTMSPGTPKPYYPNTAYAEDLAADGLPHKPFILLSGDDDGRMYILEPTSDNRTEWTYDKRVLLAPDGFREHTMGKMSHADLDNDGFEEIVIAAYSDNNVHVFTYNDGQ